MSIVKATVRPENTQKERRLNQLKAAVAAEINLPHKRRAQLIAIQFAANGDCEFDVSNALVAILVMIEQSLAGLDQLEAVS